MADCDGHPPTFVSGFHDEASVRKTTYRKLGGTDMVVSKMSLGGAPLGGVYGDCHEAHHIVQEALRNGVNLIDTSYWYGQGRSEEAIGKALKGIPRSAYYIGTKVGRYELDYPRMFDFRAERVTQSVDESLQRLGLDYVDLIQIHDFEFAPSESIILNETLPALEKIRRSGKARYIGITGYPLDKIISIIQQSSVKIDVILTYCRGTMNDSSLEQYVRFLQEHNVGIINAASTSMGMLTCQGPPEWHAASAPIKRACREAANYCQVSKVNIAKLANHYSMNFPGVHTTLVGAHSLQVITDNLETSRSNLSDTETRIQETLMTKYTVSFDKNVQEEFSNTIGKERKFEVLYRLSTDSNREPGQSKAMCSIVTKGIKFILVYVR